MHRLHRRFLRSLTGLLLTLVAASPVAAQHPETNATDCTQQLTEAHVQVQLDGDVFYPIATRDGCWIFVTLGGGAWAMPPYGVAVLRVRDGGAEPVRFFPIDTGKTSGGALPQLVLTRDERLLLVPVNGRPRGSVLLLDVETLTTGGDDADPVVGVITDHRFGGTGVVTLSPDERFLLVPQRTTDWITIIDLAKARREGFSQDAIVGGIPTTGMSKSVFSPDGRHLYMFTDGVPYGEDRNCQSDTTMHVFAVALEGTTPLFSALATTSAPCHVADTMAFSTDGSTLYLGHRGAGTGEVLAFDTRPVQNGHPPTLLSRIPGVGGLVFIDGRMAVAKGGEDGSLIAVIDATRAHEGAGAIVRSMAIGRGPGGVSRLGTSHILGGSRTSRTLHIVTIDALVAPPDAIGSGLTR